ncbi:MAG: sugar transferase [Chlorobiaceae bacterium]|nr:sugar transferase [Chlorobiaceae bacterium]
MTARTRIPLKKSWWIPKRIFDYTVSLMGLVVLLPLIATIAVVLLATSPGPVLFVQLRVGRYGRFFKCYKFRTMVPGAHELGSITTANDSRITDVGRVLRRYKLDELLLLWNVVTGTMSFVGPRPDVPGYLDRLQGDDRRILELLPGITGPATLTFKDEALLLSQAEDPKAYNDKVIYPQKVRINLRYMQDGSFWLDIGYILATLFPYFTKKTGLNKYLNLNYAIDIRNVVQ